MTWTMVLFMCVYTGWGGCVSDGSAGITVIPGFTSQAACTAAATMLQQRRAPPNNEFKVRADCVAMGDR